MRHSISNVSALLQTAVANVQSGRLDDARRICERVLRIEPKNPAALHLSGRIVAAQGDAEQGMRLIRRAIAFFPRSPGGLNDLGNLLAGKGRQEEALACYEKAIAFQPDFAAAFRNRGNAYHELHDADKARQDFATSLRLEPSSVERVPAPYRPK